MNIKQAKIAIIGGSIAGCAMAITLRRMGCAVDVYERSPTTLAARGAGIILPEQLQRLLLDMGYLPEGFPGFQLQQRDWIVDDGSAAGKRLWRQQVSGVANNWGSLWQALKADIPNDNYHIATRLVDFTNSPAGVRFTLSDGTEHDADLLIAADGYRSLIRERMEWGSESDYAGYVLWRGSVPLDRIRDKQLLKQLTADASWLSVCYSGGHAVIYLMPSGADGVGDANLSVNWAVYTPPPAQHDFSRPTSIAAGSVSAALYAQLDDLLRDSFPAQIEALLRLTRRDEISIQPIYDELAIRFADQRVLFCGDAGGVVRPHTASGATKALQDALALARLAVEIEDLDALLAAYDDERVRACNALVDTGRRIGRAQVENTPNWSAMSEIELQAWNAATFQGTQIYLYPDT